MMTFKQRRNREWGGVSIFIVIFTALLITVVTASFAQLMVRNQQQASANDLSQSAYDSALAGVEDAKRALVKLQECEDDEVSTGCAGIRDALKSNDCDSLATAGVVTFRDGEVPVGDKELNQAYTCVKVQLDTPSFKDDGVAPGVPVVVPLKSKEAFDKVRISWFTKDDLSNATSNAGVETVAFMPSVNRVLPNEGGWPESAPALLRAQLIQFNKEQHIKLDDLSKKGTKNAQTLFLYPQEYGTSSPQSQSFATTDTRRGNAQQNTPMPASCNTVFDKFGGYACQVELTLPLPEDGGTKENREAYLQLQSYYQLYTSFKVELIEGNKVVNMNEVQPRVDSTGRASSLFRRIEANISLSGGVGLAYPDAALSVGGDLCKNFFITNADSDYESHCP